MKKRKRILAGLLVLCMMCSFLPMGVFADEAAIGHMATKPADGTTTGSPFPQNTAGSHSFRIPALVTLSDGTLVAAADARWDTTYDGGGLDTVVARSTNGGTSWNYTFANYLGDNGNAYNSASSCFIDSSLAVRTTDANNDGVKEDTIFMLCDLYPNGVALNGAKQCVPSFDTGFNAAGYLKLTTLAPSTNTDNYIDSDFTHYLKDGKIYANDGTQDTAYTVDSKFNVFDANGSYVSNLFFADAPYHVARTGYLYLTKSTDGGASWSAPTLLNLKTSNERACLVGPNGGMVTSSGTIVFPVYSYTGTTEQMGLIYSTDGGNTWQRSANFTALHSSEADAVELPNGKLRVFFRNQTATLRYADFDLAAGTWGSAVNTGIPTNSNTALSAITYSQTVTHNGKQKKVILISCPASANLNGSDSSDGSWRTSGRIFAGLLDPNTCEMTWLDSSVEVTPVAPGQLSGDNYTASQGFFAYSSITELKDNGSVAILYEDNQYGWGSGTGYGYTLAYKTYSQSELEEKLGITFGDTLVNPNVPGEAKNTLSVTLNIGQTQTLTDPTGNHANNITPHPDSTIATMTVTGVDAQQGGISTTKATTLEDGATYILRVYNTSYALSSDTGRDAWNTQTLAFQSNALTVNTKHMWTLEKVDGGYKLKNANGYLNLGTGNNTAYLNTTGEVFTLAYTLTGWTIKNPHGKYINALGELFNYYSAGGWDEGDTRFDLYKVNEETAASTTISFTGVKAGTTTATVGSTTYNITVLPDITKTVDITVQAGNTFIYTDNSGVFSDILIQPDAKIATAKILGQLKPVTSIESGKQYLIVNRKTGDILTDTVLSLPGDCGNKPGLDTTGKASAESTELWTISEINGEYTVSQNGKYLAIAGYNAHLYDTETSLTLTYTPNGWTICDKYTGPALTHGPGPYYLSDYVGDNYTSGALGTSIVSNDYIHWDIYEVHPGGTVVEFTGITEGETTAIIGTTQYNITVLPDIYTVVDIELELGESFTFTDTTGNHANQVILQPDSTYATMVVTGTANGTVKELELITASTFDPGSRYILENVRAKGSQPAHSVLTSDEAYGGLVMNGPLDAPTSPTWAIIPDDNHYQLYRNGKYVTLGNRTASMESTPIKLAFKYATGNGWLISSNGYYLSDLRGDAAGEAYGYSDGNDAGNYWNIYKEIDLVTSESTQVTFSAVSEGTTTAIVGGTRYRVTVVPAEADDEIMHSATGTWTIDPEIQRQRYSSLIGLDKDLYTDDSWLVYEDARQVAYRNGIEFSNAQYPSEADAEAALAELTLLINKLEAARKQLVDAKIISVRYMLNGKSIDIQEYKLRSDENTLELPTTIVVNNTAYNVTNHQLTLGNNTTFEVPVTLIGKLGGGFVASEDIDLGWHGNKAQIADLVDSSGIAKAITKMTLTAGTSYTLNLATDVTGKTVEWTTENGTVATVNQSGEVIAINAGTTNITATVKDANGNLVEVNTIPITVFPKGTGDRRTAIYIEETENNTVWCVFNANTDDYAFRVTEGELIYGQFDTTVDDNTQTTAVSFFSNPHDGHALVHMKSTNSDDQYFLLHDNDGNLYDGTSTDDENDTKKTYYVSGLSSGAGYWQAMGLGSNNTANVDWTPIRDMVQWSIDHGCDGGLGFTRRQTEGNLASNLSFVSNPMPRIEKSVDGVLPTTRKQANYRRYVENMVAAVDEQVYFKITVTLEAPNQWRPKTDASGNVVKDASGNMVYAEDENGNRFAAITYSNASISDTILPGAYLYTKKLDQDSDGTWDGNIAPEYRSQTDSITAQLNAAWTPEELAAGKRVLDYYLVYTIQEADIPKFWIDNIADLNYNYKSHYSYGAQAGSAEAEARITVVGSDIDDVVIDFGQTITYTGLTSSQLKGVYVDGENDVPGVTQCKATAKFGDVTVTRKQQTDDSDAPLFDHNGYPQYEYTVTYTPHSILQETDAVVLYGIGEMGQEKIINGFLVYPATTVYYEEGFMMNEASNWSDGDNETYDYGAKATGQQTLELLGKFQYDEHRVPTKVTDQKHPYGYDPLYEQEGYTHGNSYALSNTVGDTTTFTFTGTGFDLFANCDSDTGYVSVVVKNSAGKYVKMYTVNTVVKAGETPSTSGQTGTQYHLPIVSADLKTHDTYTVTVTKIMDTKPVKLDGIRIYNTLADSSSFNIDLEDNPEFYQLRDYVLTAVDVNKIASKLYGPDWLNNGSAQIGVLGEQVYGAISTDSELPCAIITSIGDIYGAKATAQDLLDNGPKNELYLYPGQTLAFEVTTSREMQIGLKAPRTATSYTLCYEVGHVVTSVATEKPIATSVDMFYALGNPIGTEQEYLITVKNTGDDILSITNLKICDDPNAAFVPLTQKNIEQILVNSGLGTSEDEGQDPPVLPETPKFDIDLAQLRLGNELTLFFLFPMDSYADWTGCYAEITKPNGDTTVTVPVESWETGFRKDGKELYRVAFDGLAAKEMADDVSIVIYNAKGEAISNVGTESIRSYLMRMLDKRTDAESRRLAVDMLNYGAAAQQYFSYNTGDLANSLLDDTQKAYGTLEDAPCQNKQIKGDNAYGTSLELGSSILVKFYFDGMTRDMTATVTFRSHAADKPVTYNLKNQGNHFLVDQIVVADGRQELVVTVYNADGSVYGTMTDSIESYVARGSDRDALYQAILKFSDSAYAYLHK